MIIIPMQVQLAVNESKEYYDLSTSETINVSINDIPDYEGSYVVVPEIRSQTLQTKDKKMTDDVLVREIPYYETSNIQNGITVFIADNLND